MVDTGDLKSPELKTRVGSSPASGTRSVDMRANNVE